MSMQTFALVEWIGDEKPECWQVVKSTDAFPKVKKIQEAGVLDGIWKEGEETCPAKILKVHDSKHYLQTVKENEYCKPWRNKVPEKRSKSIPKTLQEFVTDSEPEASKKQEDTGLGSQIRKKQKTDMNQTKKIKNKAPAPKKNENKKTGVIQDIAPSESEDEENESSFSKKIMKSSKEEAEKVLAAAILRKRRASSPIIPLEDVHKRIQVSPAKVKDITDEENELLEINNKVGTFGLPKIRKNMDQECCRCCKEYLEELKELRQELNDLKKSFRKMKKTLNEVRTSQTESCGESNPTTSLEKSYREAVKNSTSLFTTINHLMRTIYSKEEILAHSVSGKAANSKIAAKPKFDERLELVKKIAIDVHGIEHATQPKITAKIQAVQKAVKREMEGKDS